MLGLKAKLRPSPHSFPTTYRETPLENTLENEKQQAEELIECVDQISLVGNREWQNKEMSSWNKASRMALSSILN